jgi:hypothetical protein
LRDSSSWSARQPHKLEVGGSSPPLATKNKLSMSEDPIRQKIKNSGYYKFQTVAPEGFLLVPEEVIEQLKDFENWKEFKHDPNWIEDKSKEVLKNI